MAEQNWAYFASVSRIIRETTEIYEEPVFCEDRSSGQIFWFTESARQGTSLSYNNEPEAIYFYKIPLRSYL